MSQTTSIEWCDATFNPWIGCTKVSPGCANCYAEGNVASKFMGIKWGKEQKRRRTSESNWELPRRWNRAEERVRAPDGADKKRPRVFCASLADCLDHEVPIEWLADLLQLIHETPNLDWLLLTKRPENWGRRLMQVLAMQDWRVEDRRLTGRFVEQWCVDEVAPANVWFGVSVEDHAWADERIPALLKIPARVRFLSVEPLLGPVEVCKGSFLYRPEDSEPTDEFRTSPITGKRQMAVRVSKTAERLLHWVIVGGESGPKARPCNVEWVRSVLGQCKAAGVPCFVKQLGSRPDYGTPFDKPGGYQWPIKHPKGGDMNEWPEDLRIREMPELAA